METRSVVKSSALFSGPKARDCCFSLLVKDAYNTRPPDLCGGNLLQDRQEDLGGTTYSLLALKQSPVKPLLKGLWGQGLHHSLGNGDGVTHKQLTESKFQTPAPSPAAVQRLEKVATPLIFLFLSACISNRL